jgi:hypothetical protein
MHDFTSTLKSNKRKWGLHPRCSIQRALLYWYVPHQHQATVSSYAYQRKVQKCNIACMNSIYFKIRYKKNTTMNDKVYSKISKMNFIYQVIWLMWILKLGESNSNNKWKRVDHGATFTYLLQLSSHKIKYGSKEHHLTISNSQHQNKHTHETINKHNDPTLPPVDRQKKQSTPTMENCILNTDSKVPNFQTS